MFQQQQNICPLFTIVIPTWNSGKTIIRALDSLKKQQYTNWECIIVDDHSKDNTVEIVKEYIETDFRFKVYIRNNDFAGPSSTRNFGVKIAKGKYLVFLDSDDILLPHCLNNRKQFIDESLDFIVTPMFVRNANQDYEKKIPLKVDYLYDFLIYSFHWQTMCVTWSNKYFKDIGMFNEELIRLEDPELMIRAFLNTKRYKVFTDNPDSIYFTGEKNPVAMTYIVFESVASFLKINSESLRKHNKIELIPLLQSYYYAWFNHYYFPSNLSLLRIPVKLILCSLRYNVISLTKAIKHALYIILYFILNGTRFFLRKQFQNIPFK